MRDAFFVNKKKYSFLTSDRHENFFPSLFSFFSSSIFLLNRLTAQITRTNNNNNRKELTTNLVEYYIVILLKKNAAKERNETQSGGCGE